MKDPSLSTSFRTGDDSMDQQHKMIFDYLNELFDALTYKRDKKSLLILLDKLYQYTDFHFSEEEEDMKRHQYPEYKFHKLIHQKLLSELKRIEREIVNGVPPRERLKYELCDWFDLHIREADKAYSDFLHSLRVKPIHTNKTLREIS